MKAHLKPTEEIFDLPCCKGRPPMYPRYCKECYQSRHANLTARLVPFDDDDTVSSIKVTDLNLVVVLNGAPDDVNLPGLTVQDYDDICTVTWNLKRVGKNKSVLTLNGALELIHARFDVVNLDVQTSLNERPTTIFDKSIEIFEKAKLATRSAAIPFNPHIPMLIDGWNHWAVEVCNKWKAEEYFLLSSRYLTPPNCFVTLATVCRNTGGIKTKNTKAYEVKRAAVYEDEDEPILQDRLKLIELLGDRYTEFEEYVTG